MSGGAPLLQVDGLTKHYDVPGLFSRPAVVRALDGVSFTLPAGGTLGLLGESGCGKTTLARTLLRLVEPTSGSALLEGESIFDAKGPALFRMRRAMQMIFQDPTSSLDPSMTAGQIVAEPLEVHRMLQGAGRRARVGRLFELVGLSQSAAGRHPHELSGGQRQRVGIARALALEPKLIVADEPVSSLDVSVQAQVLELLTDLRAELGLSYLLIAHELHVVRRLADAVGVMYMGRIVEMAPAGALFGAARHPYTEALLAAAPVPDPEAAQAAPLPLGEVPSAADPPPGCRFHPRCPLAEKICEVASPELADIGGGHLVACHVRARSAHTGPARPQHAS